MNLKNILTVGVLLIVAWIALKLVFKVVGLVFHVLLLAGILFVIWYFVGKLMDRGRHRV